MAAGLGVEWPVWGKKATWRVLLTAVGEDARPGVAAAKAAGMASVGLVSTGRTRQELGAADLVVDSLGELSPEVLRQLISRRPGGTF